MDRTERVGYVVLEAFLIAVGVVLALAAENWWSEREARGRAENALTAISAEMTRNAGVLAPAVAYHDSLAGSLTAASSQPGITWDQALLANFRGVATPQLTSAAWDVAVATGALEAAPDSVMARLIEVYALQEWLISFANDLRVPHLIAFSETDPTPASLNLLGFSISDLHHFEAHLLQELQRNVRK